MDIIYFTLIGSAILIIISLKIYFYFIKNKDEKWLKEFKRAAVKLSVKLSDIIVLSNSWTEEREKYTTQRTAGIVLYNKLTHNDTKNIDYVKVNLNHIFYKFKYNGKTYTYEQILNYDKDALRIQFAFMKETFMYLNPTTDEMYLDLEFLNN